MLPRKYYISIKRQFYHDNVTFEKITEKWGVACVRMPNTPFFGLLSNNATLSNYDTPAGELLAAI
jgi:hypothetical protein